jgi:polysaccharide export outer membrane protein
VSFQEGVEEMNLVLLRSAKCAAWILALGAARSQEATRQASSSGPNNDKDYRISAFDARAGVPIHSRGKTATRAGAAEMPALRRIGTTVNGQTTRVTLDLEDSVQFTSGRLSNPNRIFFDLHGVRVTSEVARRKIHVDSRLLTGVRVGQSQAGVVRVVLDVNGVRDYRASLTDNPPQLLIDLHGAPATVPLDGAKAKREQQPAAGDLKQTGIGTNTEARPVENTASSSPPAQPTSESEPSAGDEKNALTSAVVNTGMSSVAKIGTNSSPQNAPLLVETKLVETNLGAASAPVNSGAAALKGLTDYVIGEGDILVVNVWKEKEISQELPVRPDGKISLPLLGEMEASKLTPVQLQQVIAEKLKTYLKNPQVAVIVKEPRSHQYNVMGQVVRPGAFPLLENVTVLDALAVAGGFKDFAKKTKIYVLRPAPDGVRVRIRFNFKQVIIGRNVEQNIVLKSGDTVVVP